MGIRFRLIELSWSGVKNLSTEQLTRLMPMQPGDAYDVRKIRIMLDGIARLYRATGYKDISVSPDAEIDAAIGAVRLTLHVDEGKKKVVSPDELDAEQR